MKVGEQNGVGCAPEKLPEAKRCTSQSTAASVMAASGNSPSQAENGWLAVIARLLRS